MQNNVNYGLVVNREGVPIKASAESVTAAAAAALNGIPDDLRYSITNAPGKDSYPISGTAWTVVYVNQPAAKDRQVADFLRWITHDGQNFCDEFHYAKLPPGLVARVDKRLGLIQHK